MLKTWCIYTVSLISAFIFFLCYKMWVSWFCLIVILLVPLIALAMSIFAAQTLSVSTEAPNASLVGTPAYIRVTVKGYASYFSFCHIRTTYIDRMAGTSRKVIIGIHDEGVTKIPIDTSHCGAYSYQMSYLEIYDLFGFFRTRRLIEKENEILVRPVPVLPDIMPDMYGFKAKSLRKSKQPNTEIYDIRDYQKGDPVKSIHWKMSAKKDKLLVKESLEEYGGHSRVILRLTEDRELLDRHLGQVLFTSRFYIEHETSHKIRVIPPDRSEVAFEVESEFDLERAITQILRMRIPNEETQSEGFPDDFILEGITSGRDAAEDRSAGASVKEKPEGEGIHAD